MATKKRPRARDGQYAHRTVARRRIWKPSSMGMSGIAIGGIAGGAAAGPIGAFVGMGLGLAAGEVIEHTFPSDAEDREPARR